MSAHVIIVNSSVYVTLSLYVCVCVCELSLSVMSNSFEPMDCGLPGSSVHGIFQSRILEWVVIFFSRGSSRPRDWTHVFLVSCISGRFFTAEPLGKPWACIDNDSYLYFMNKFLCDNLVQILYENWECYEFYFILAFFFKLQTKLQHMACY